MDFDEEMAQHYTFHGCDYLTEYEIYIYCSECYRYEICKKEYLEELKGKTN